MPHYYIPPHRFFLHDLRTQHLFSYSQKGCRISKARRLFYRERYLVLLRQPVIRTSDEQRSAAHHRHTVEILNLHRRNRSSYQRSLQDIHKRYFWMKYSSSLTHAARKKLHVSRQQYRGSHACYQHHTLRILSNFRSLFDTKLEFCIIEYINQIKSMHTPASVTHTKSVTCSFFMFVFYFYFRCENK